MEVIQPITGQGLNLVPVRDSHAAALYELRSDELVNTYIHRHPPKGIEEIEEKIRGWQKGNREALSYYWVIESEDGDVKGTICLWNLEYVSQTAEVGYELFPSAQGKGIMSRALFLVLQFAFQNLKLQRVLAYTHFENQASLRLLRSMKFRRLTHLFDQDFPNNVVLGLGAFAFENGLKWDTLERLEDRDLNHLMKLWNEEYPKTISWNGKNEALNYLNSLEDCQHHFILQDDEIVAWAARFTRQSNPWFALIVNRNFQGKGVGSYVMKELMSMTPSLYGWVSISDDLMRSDGSIYKGPIDFYQKLGFEKDGDEEFQMGEMTCVLIKWKKDEAD